MIDMLAIIGLGNPGKKFKKTRHNLGSLILDDFHEKNGFVSWRKSQGANAFYSKKTINSKEIHLVKPLTSMNNSGQTAKHVLQKYHLQTDDIVVVHDDLGLAFGEIKVSQGRGSGGHKGVQSVIDELGSKNFARVRVGIKPLGAQIRPEDWCDFVLNPFNKKEEELLKKARASACSTIELIIGKGIEQAMTEFN